MLLWTFPAPLPRAMTVEIRKHYDTAHAGGSWHNPPSIAEKLNCKHPTGNLIQNHHLFVFCCCLGSWICYNQTSEINKHDPIENVPRSSSGHTEDCRARWCVYDDLGVRDWKTYFRRWVYHLLWPKENTGMELIFTCRYLKLFIQRQRTYLFRIHSLIVSHLPLTYNIKVVWVSNWNVNMGVRYKVFP